jgi:SAM-dependent methyltransferase
VGVDIAKPMLEVAVRRPRSAPDLLVAFRQLDAQTGDLGHGFFDAAFSRFGVMFFSDPVAAFANIRAFLKPGGRLASTFTPECGNSSPSTSAFPLQTP